MSERVALLGSSGAVGARGLVHLLSDDRVGRVTALVRRPLAQSHAKLVAAVDDLRGALGLLIPDDVTCAVCCVGTTMKQAGSREAFVAIDKDLVVRFARAALERGARRFVLISSVGASAASRSFYLRVKGETEDAVSSLDFARVTILRPSLLYAERARQGRPGEALGLAIMKGVRAVIGKHHRYAPISVDVVGRAAARLAVDAPPSARVLLYESEALHGLGAAPDR